ncbi:MAG: hypothetical protein ABI315_06430 [Bacteroidia bacterium]
MKKSKNESGGSSRVPDQKNIQKEKRPKKFPGYPDYPAKDDIYNKGKEEKDLDPENINKIKSPNAKPGKANEKDFGDVVTGSDLDVPGSELDDQQEDIGSEDEENNYYSIGGDDHNDLDEDNG